MLPFRKSDSRATTPVRGSVGAAGFDLFSLQDVILPPHSTNEKIATGISIDLQALRESSGLPTSLGVYGRVAPRSGHAARDGLDVLAGVIDEDYRGDIFVIMTNPNAHSVHIPRNKAIAQLIPEIYVRSCGMVEATSDLSTTERGSGGFGSTDFQSSGHK